MANFITFDGVARFKLGGFFRLGTKGPIVQFSPRPVVLLPSIVTWMEETVTWLGIPVTWRL